MILLGPPGVGKTHLAMGLGIKTCQAEHPVLFNTAAGWVTDSPKPTNATEASPRKSNGFDATDY